MTFETYKSRVGTMGATVGQAARKESDVLMETTWDRDIQTKGCYIYDYYHDGEPNSNRNLKPYNDNNKTLVSCKFIVSQYNTISKDQSEYHLQFRPSHECELDYFAEYERKYGVEYPIGCYVDIPDERGIYRRWLICGEYSHQQFKQYLILPCNYYFHWCIDGKVYSMWGVARLRNSYNSGVWTDYMITSVENQDQMWLPTNEITTNLDYDQRLIVCVNGLKTPITWKISKIETIHPLGINKFTLYQTEFNPETDRQITKDGREYWVADYLKGDIEAAPAIIHDDNIEYKNCIEPNIKTLYIGGAAKTVTARLYNESRQLINDIEWKFYADDDLIPAEDVAVINGISCTLSISDDSYIGSVLRIVASNTDGSVTTEMKVNLRSV